MTCLREKLAAFRLSIKMSEERKQQGKLPSKRVTDSWRAENVLAPATLEILEGELLPVYEPGVLSRLEEDLKDLLIRLKIRRLDLSQVQGSRRRLTQPLARAFFDWGAAGVLYRSRYDGEVCVALFEGRARLIPAGEPKRLSEPLSELDRVCEEFRLDIEPRVAV